VSGHNGDPGLGVQKEATTAAFIVAAVLVEDEHLAAVRAAVEVVGGRTSRLVRSSRVMSARTTTGG
jgi:hypothetical protein